MANEARRQPFDPITTLPQTPLAMWEALAMSNEAGMTRLSALLESVIRITLSDPEAWEKLAAMRADAPSEQGGV